MATRIISLVATQGQGLQPLVASQSVTQVLSATNVSTTISVKAST